MDPDVLLEVLDKFDRVVGHASYVVCGLAAMAVWGYPYRQPTVVNIICPAHSKDAIKAWAAAAGMYLYGDKPDTIGVQTVDGVVRHIRLEAWNSGFSSLVSTRPALEREVAPLYVGTLGKTLPTQARVATLPTLLNGLGGSYVRDRTPIVTSTQARRDIALFIFWVLRRIIDSFANETPPHLAPEEVPQIISGTFWYPFTTAYPDATDLFAKAGVPDAHLRPVATVQLQTNLDERDGAEMSAPPDYATATESLYPSYLVSAADHNTLPDDDASIRAVRDVPLDDAISTDAGQTASLSSDAQSDRAGLIESFSDLTVDALCRRRRTT